MDKTTYNIPLQLSVATYEKLLNFLFRTCTTCSMVVRHSIPLTSEGVVFLKNATPYLVRRQEQSEWPGTVLQGDTAEVYYFALNPALELLMQAQTSDLRDWQQPNLPEDPAFFRNDGTVMLGTVTHEGDVFMELTIEELNELREIRELGLTLLLRS